MKFCSVGAVKYKRERDGANMLQYLFDGTTQKPTNAQSLLSIIPDARSITYNIDGSKLTCSPVAGQLNSRLYLTNVIIASFGVDSSSQPALVAAGTKPYMDAFYMFGCVWSDQNTSTSINSGARGVLDPKTTRYYANWNSPFNYTTKTGISGHRMVLYPNKLSSGGTTLPTKSDYNLSTAHNYSYSYSTTYTYWDLGNKTATRSYSYTTYMSQVTFRMLGVNVEVASKASVSVSGIPAGDYSLTASAVSVPGIQFFRPTYYYVYSDSRYGTTTAYYNEGAYNRTTGGTVTDQTLLPYIARTGTDELIDFAFSAIGYRDLDKDNIVIRDFGSDLTHAASTYPNNIPDVTLNTLIELDQLTPVVEL